MGYSELVRSFLLCLSKPCSSLPCKNKRRSSAHQDPADDSLSYEKEMMKDLLSGGLSEDWDVFCIPAPFLAPRFHDTIKHLVYDHSPYPPPSPLPEGITAKEYDTIKLVAQFASRYWWFEEELKKRNDPRFDFLFQRTDHDKHVVFRMLWYKYCRVIITHDDKPERPSSELELMVEAFIHLLQGEGAFVSAVDYFANIQLPPHGHESTKSQPEDGFFCWNKKRDPQLRKRIDSAASAIASLGSWLEEKMKENNGSNPEYSFLHSTDANNKFYRKKLAKYRAQKGLVPVPAPYEEPRWGDYPPELPPCPFPQGITVKEYDTITLTAQFAVRYRTCFTEELKKRNDPRFDFVESSSGDKFIVFCWLCGLYSRVILPCHKRTMPSSMEPVVEDMIQLIQGQKRQCAFVSLFDYFADIELLPPPGHLSVMMNPSTTLTHEQPISSSFS